MGSFDPWGAITGAWDDAVDFVGGAWDDLTGVTAVEQATKAQKQAASQSAQQLSPYAQAGLGSLQQQQALSGALGPEAQAQAYAALQDSPAFQAMLAQGENSILQNASATGGLRGGNTQGALAQFAPQMLGQFAQQQYNNLGGITSLGQNAAAGVGNYGMQAGQAAAEGALGKYQTQKNMLSDAAAFGLTLATL